MYEFLPSTRFLCGKAEKSGTAENERNKAKKRKLSAKSGRGGNPGVTVSEIDSKRMKQASKRSK